MLDNQVSDQLTMMLLAILTSPETGSPMLAHRTIEAIAERGLESDRYSVGKGFYSGVKEWDAHVTLVQSEAFEELRAAHGVTLDPKELRRNLVTRGVDLNSLIGRKFRIGEQAIFRGRKAWPPCSHIVKVSGRIEIFKYFATQCGIGADVLVSGQIQTGDPIVALPE